jgi:hypothetical protein
MASKIEMEAWRDGIPGFRNALEKHWLPMWKAMGIAKVAEQVMARHGPAVDDAAWSALKVQEAQTWVNEELARAEREKVILKRWDRQKFWIPIVMSACALMLSLFNNAPIAGFASKLLSQPSSTLGSPPVPAADIAR